MKREQLLNSAENYGYPSLKKLKEKPTDQIQSSLDLFLTLFPCWLSDLYIEDRCQIPLSSDIWIKKSANTIINLDGSQTKETLNIRVKPIL